MCYFYLGYKQKCHVWGDGGMWTGRICIRSLRTSRKQTFWFYIPGIWSFYPNEYYESRSNTQFVLWHIHEPTSHHDRIVCRDVTKAAITLFLLYWCEGSAWGACPSPWCVPICKQTHRVSRRKWSSAWTTWWTVTGGQVKIWKERGATMKTLGHDPSDIKVSHPVAAVEGQRGGSAGTFTQTRPCVELSWQLTPTNPTYVLEIQRRSYFQGLHLPNQH